MMLHLAPTLPHKTIYNTVETIGVTHYKQVYKYETAFQRVQINP